MCCIMGYAGHDLPKETFTEYLLRTTCLLYTSDAADDS